MKSRGVNKTEENFAKSFVTFRFVKATQIIVGLTQLVLTEWSASANIAEWPPE